MMKARSRFLKSSVWLAAFAVGLSLCQTSSAVVSFTVTPSTVSNTYSGFITLQVAGLNSGETVVIQKFLDANTNGVIDGSDWLVHQFQLTDGQAGMVIGGIVNSNVPGDTDSTAGQITAKLNFRSGDISQYIAGKFLYRLSSPTGRFTPVTYLFTVTNFPFGQNFTGNVVSNNTSTTLPNAVVLLFPPPRPGEGGPSGSPVVGAVANNSGSYTIPAPAGTYMPVAFKSNFLANFASPPILTLAGGATIITNLTLTNTTASISGTLVDASNSNIKLPGTLLTAGSANGFMGIAFTDTNGNFSVRVQAGQWGVSADDLSLIVHGYVGLQNETNINAGTTGKNLGYPKATALFYGSVKDNLGNPLAGIDIYANDSGSGLYQADGYTDTNGNYFAAVLGGLGSNDPWWLGVSSDSSPTNYVFSQPAFLQNGGTNVSAGTAVLANFTALLAANHIVGNVSCNGTNIAGVGVWANATINGANYNAYVDTGTNGNYWLNVPNGSWTVGVNCGGGGDSLDNILGFGTYMCPNNQAVTINNNNATNNFTVQLCSSVLILTTNLPDGQVGSYYNQFLQGSSCSGTLNWTLNDPQNFPSSLGWSGNGQIQGTPDTSGTYHFSVHLVDGNGHSANQNLSLYIAPSSSPLQVTTTSLPNGTNGAFYTQQLQASGGQTPYSWRVPVYSADLPANLTLATNGVLSGTLAASGTFNFDVEVEDAAATVAYQTLSLYIVNPPLPPLVITNISLPNGNVGAFYSAQLGATGGQSPYTWSLATGSANPPSGLTLYSSGLISGTPTTNKVSTFKVQAMDANFTTTNKVFSITINPKPVLSAPAWLTNRFQMLLTGATGQNYTVQVSTNLSATDWISLLITNSSATNSFNVVDPGATNSPRFYRVLIGP